MPDLKTGRPSLMEQAATDRAEVKRAAKGWTGRWRLILAAIGALSAVAILAYIVGGAIAARRDDPGVASRIRVAIDSETGEVFRDYRVSEGATLPWKNPKTGRHTLFPAATCYWTREGKAKLEPTYVLLNEDVGKPGPTLCPDCGRVVVPHNPMPPTELLVEAAEAARAGQKK